MVDFLQVFHHSKGMRKKKINGITVAGVTLYSLFHLYQVFPKNKGLTTENIWPRLYPSSSEHLRCDVKNHRKRMKGNMRDHFLSVSVL